MKSPCFEPPGARSLARAAIASALLLSAGIAGADPEKASSGKASPPSAVPKPEAGSAAPAGVPLPPASWEPWSSRPELMPATNVVDDQWAIESDGSPSCQGGWDLRWNKIEPGSWYRVEATCRASEVPHIHDNAHAELIWWRADGERADWAHVQFQPLPTPGQDITTCRFSQTSQAPPDAVAATLRLMLRWTDRGRLAWSEPTLTETPPPADRKFKVAIATGTFPGKSVEANLAFALELVERAARAGAEVVCLPECITTWRTKDLEHLGARPIPGDETAALCEAARRLKVDIVCSMSELNGALIHNTGLYIDAGRGITGKYRKVHLSVGERWRGVTPGDSFPVWETRHGKAGMLICYDNVMPEGHRILSQKGAEMIFLPIMGDPRAVGEQAYENWLRIMQVRAMDNHVWFVVCQNVGKWGLVIRPDGQIAGEVNPETGMALVEIDPEARFDSWIGSDFENRYWGERRPHLYRELVEDR